MITLWLALTYLLGMAAGVLLLERVEWGLDHDDGHVEETTAGNVVDDAADHPATLDRAA